MQKKTLSTLFLVSGAVLVLVLCVVMGLLAHRHQMHKNLFRAAEEAFQKGDYDLAKNTLTAFLRVDPNHEKAWEYLAEIFESSQQWEEAGAIWNRLVKLNVLNEEYLKRHILAMYRAHNFQQLNRVFSNLSDEKRNEYKEIDALTQFIVNPMEEKTNLRIAGLPKESDTLRLIQAMKQNGPAEELAFLETVPDPVIQVEALLLNAYLAEVKEHQLKRAEECYRKASEINPEKCLPPLGKFLFRHIRYKDAKEVYEKLHLAMMSDENIANYAEILFFLKENEELAKLEQKIPRRIRASLPLRAYIQSLQAYMEHDSQNMVKNYRVAQMDRSTPVGLLLSYAVAVESSDLPLMSKVLTQWKQTKLFQEKLASILPQMRTAVETAMNEKKLEDAARLGVLFLEVSPPEPLAWRAVIQDQAERGTLSDKLIQEAIKRFPQEELYRKQALELALRRRNKDQILSGYDQLIAVSKEPASEYYRKILFLEYQGLKQEADAELKKLLEKEKSLVAAKHALAFGLHTGNQEALHFAENYPELADIVKFEQERRNGDVDKAIQFLRDTPIEQALSHERQEDRELLFPLAVYLALAHVTDRAVKIYTDLIPYMGNNPTVELNLSEIYADAGQFELALKYAADALQKAPSSNIVKIVYALRCADKEDYAQALTYLPDNVSDENLKTILINCLEKSIADAFEKQRFATCRTYLQRLQRLQPQNPIVQEYLEKLNKR
ncbi:MAG: hypothetical protein IJJ26_09665 [Victivallales bacterium]|nr:hypothetical protein [Victivallales bacterium]